MVFQKNRRALQALWLCATTIAVAGFSSCGTAADFPFPFATAVASPAAGQIIELADTRIAPSAAPRERGIAAVNDRLTTGPRLARTIPLPRPRPRHRQAAGAGIFSSIPIALAKLPAAQRLQPAEQEMKAHTIGDCSAIRCQKIERTLADAIKRVSGEGFSAQIRAVNETVNRLVRYRADSDNYGRLDHWATPRQTLVRGAGDCEDFAILKMASLRALGIPNSSMSLVVLRDDDRNLYHAVLAIKTDRGFFILDNLRDRVVLDSELPHYTPLFSIAAGRGYIHARRITGGGPATAATSLDNVTPGEGFVAAGMAGGGGSAFE